MWWKVKCSAVHVTCGSTTGCGACEQHGVVSTEGASSRWECAVRRGGSYEQHKSYGEQRVYRYKRGYACSCTQSLLRSLGAGGYKQDWGNSLSLV